jgi:hypothetical protein
VTVKELNKSTCYGLFICGRNGSAALMSHALFRYHSRFSRLNGWSLGGYGREKGELIAFGASFIKVAWHPKVIILIMAGLLLQPGG